MSNWLSNGNNFSSPGLSWVVKRICFFSFGILYIYRLDLHKWLRQNTSSSKTFGLCTLLLLLLLKAHLQRVLSFSNFFINCVVYLELWVILTTDIFAVYFS